MTCMKRHNYYLEPSDMKQTFRQLITGLNTLDQFESIQITEFMLDIALLDVFMSTTVNDKVKKIVDDIFGGLEIPSKGPTVDVWKTKIEFTELRNVDKDYIKKIIDRLDQS